MTWNPAASFMTWILLIYDRCWNDFFFSLRQTSYYTDANYSNSPLKRLEVTVPKYWAVKSFLQDLYPEIMEPKL